MIHVKAKTNPSANSNTPKVGEEFIPQEPSQVVETAATADSILQESQETVKYDIPKITAILGFFDVIDLDISYEDEILIQAFEDFSQQLEDEQVASFEIVLAEHGALDIEDENSLETILYQVVKNENLFDFETTEVEAEDETEVEAEDETEVEAEDEQEIYGETEVEAEDETEVEAEDETEVEDDNLIEVGEVAVEEFDLEEFERGLLEPEIEALNNLVHVSVKQNLLVKFRVSSTATKHLTGSEMKPILNQIGQVVNIDGEQNQIEFGEKFVDGYNPLAVGKEGSNEGWLIKPIREYVKYLNRVNDEALPVFSLDSDTSLISESIRDMVLAQTSILPIYANFGDLVSTLANHNVDELLDDENELPFDQSEVISLEDLYSNESYLATSYEGTEQTVNIVNVLNVELPVIHRLKPDSVIKYVKNIQATLGKLTTRANFDVSIAFTMDALDLIDPRYQAVAKALAGENFAALSRSNVEFNELDVVADLFEITDADDSEEVISLFESQDLLYIKKIVDLAAIEAENEDESE